MMITHEDVEDDNLAKDGVAKTLAAMTVRGSTFADFIGAHRTVSRPEDGRTFDVSLIQGLNEAVRYPTACRPIIELSSDPGRRFAAVSWESTRADGSKDHSAVMRTPDKYLSGDEELHSTVPGDPGPGQPGEYVLEIHSSDGSKKYRYLDAADLAEAVLEDGAVKVSFSPNPERLASDGAPRKLTMYGDVANIQGFRLPQPGDGSY
jgi:hypothetical protein